MGTDAPGPVLIHYDNFPRLHLPDIGGPQGIQGAGFGAEEPAFPQLAHAQGPEAVGVPDGDELLGGHDNQGVGPPELFHGPFHRCLDGGALEPLPGDDMGDNLGIAGGVEDAAGKLQLLPQLGGVHQVAVVGHRHGALDVVNDHGLGVGPAAGAGGGVPDMAHSHLPLAQGGQDVLGEDLAHQPQVLMVADDPVIADGDAAALLPPVLEGVEGQVGGNRHILFFTFIIDAKEAAFFMDGIKHTFCFPFLWWTAFLEPVFTTLQHHLAGSFFALLR